MKSLCRALALQIGLWIWVAAAAGSPAPVSDLEARLAAAVAGGDLDPGRADLYRLYALLDAGRLPAELRVEVVEDRGAWQERRGAPASPQMRVLRCGTTLLRAVEAGIPRMTWADQAEALRLLEPLRRRAARTASRVAGKTVQHVLPHWITTENFSIEWGDGLTNEDGDPNTPVRDDDGDGVPDVVQRWASFFEAAFRAEVVDRGFTHPALDGALVPVYIANSDPAYPLASGTYALTSEEDPVPTILVNNNFRFVPPNDAGVSGLAKIAGAMKITAAHELFHVIHFLYEPAAWVPREDDWWFEASSTWMEDEVFDSVNDYHQYFGDDGWAFYVEDGLPVPNFVANADRIPRAYGSVIFAKYLSEHVGGENSMAEVWGVIRGGRRILGALDVYARQKGFGSLEHLFLGFAAANATMDYRDGEAYRLTAAQAIPVRRMSLSADSATRSLPVPEYLGATYLERQGGTGAAVRVELTGTPAARWGLAFSLGRSEGFSLALGALGAAGKPSLTAASVRSGDTLYAVPCFLDPSRNPTGYKTEEPPPSASDLVPPGPVSLLAGFPAARTGGFDLVWAAATDSDAAGYVVRWREAGQPVFRSAKTFFGPVTSAEIRGVSPGSYEVQVFAYDGAGNADVTLPAAPAVVSEPGGDTPTPPAQILEKKTGELPSSEGDGGGGGGGGCFLRSLSHRGRR